MFRAYILWIVLVGWVVSVSECSLTIPGWFSWTPQGSNRTDLYCPDSCQHNQWIEECCSCDSRTCYEMNPIPEGCNVTIADLTIEYTSLAFASMLNVRLLNETNATYFSCIHTNGKMTSLPGNICDFPNIIRIEVRGNRIESIGDLSCVSELNVLDLSKNGIKYVSNETFTNLTQLRTVNLSRNAIEVLEPNTFLKNGGNLFTVDMSYNDFDNLDITNILVEGPFCARSFRGCALEDPSNEYGFKIDKTTHYGPGDVDFQNSTLGSFLNFTDYGIDYSELERYVSISFHHNGFYLKCDCQLVPYLKVHSYPGILRFMPELANDLICQDPEHMKGNALNALNFDDKLDSLTCDLKEFCPDKCTCTDIQSQRRVTVNCTNAGLTSLPEYMPFGSWNSSQLDIILDGNNIKHLDNREYLNRVNSISLTGNPIQVINDIAINIMADNVVIDLSHSVARKLPKTLQRKDPNLLRFGSVPILCDCSNVWIGEWLQRYDAYNKLKCEIDGQIVKAESITEKMLDCTPEEGISVLAVALSVILVVLCAVAFSTALYLARIELFILKRRFMQWVRDRELHHPGLPYHMYVIFDEDYDEPLIFKKTTGKNICDWVRCELKTSLSKEGLANFVPYLDILLGREANKEDQVYQAISDSEAYVFIYTDKCLNRADPRSQFESVWTQFTKYPHKSIFVINFDGTPVSNVPDRRMRALFRVGHFLDYTVTTTRMVDRLVKRYHSLYFIDKTDDDIQEDVRVIHPEPDRRHVYPEIAVSPANRAFDNSIFNQNRNKMRMFQAANKKEHTFDEEPQRKAYLPGKYPALTRQNIDHQYLKRTPSNYGNRIPVMGFDSKGTAKQQFDAMHGNIERVGSAKSSSSFASVSKVPLQFTVNMPGDLRPNHSEPEPFSSNHDSLFSMQMESKRMRHSMQDRQMHGSISTSEEHLRSRGRSDNSVQQRYGPLSGVNRRTQSNDRVTAQSKSSTSSTPPVVIHREWSPHTKNLDRSQTPLEEIDGFTSGRYGDSTFRASGGGRWMTATPVIHSDDSSSLEGSQDDQSPGERYGARHDIPYSRYNY